MDFLLRVRDQDGAISKSREVIGRASRPTDREDRAVKGFLVDKVRIDLSVGSIVIVVIVVIAIEIVVVIGIDLVVDLEDGRLTVP